MFYTQSELQSLARDRRAVEEILAKLAQTGATGIEEREKTIVLFGEELGKLAVQLTDLENHLADAEQALAQSVEAQTQLEVYAAAGIDELNYISRQQNHWREATKNSKQLGSVLTKVSQSVAGFAFPEIDARLLELLGKDEGNELRKMPTISQETFGKIKDAREAWSRLVTVIERVTDAVADRERSVRFNVDRALASQGLGGAEINELQALNRHVSFLKIYESNRDEIRNRRDTLQKSFDYVVDQNKRLTQDQRDAFDHVIDRVHGQTNGRIHVDRIESGERGPLNDFILSLGHSGITRWWNQVKNGDAFSSHELLDLLDAGTHTQIKMSDAVAVSFREHL